LLFFKYVIV